VKIHFPFAHSLFMRIAEPRTIRLMQFGVYVCLIFSGVGMLQDPPSSFKDVVGAALVYVFSGFITLGSVLGAIAVLPGIWWLERVGILALATGLSMYLVLVMSLGASPIGIAVALAFILTFLQRWTEIKGAQLAPREE